MGRDEIWRRISISKDCGAVLEVTVAKGESFWIQESKKIHCAYGQIVTEVIGATVLE